MCDTPKYWGEYLDFLKESYEIDMARYRKDLAKAKTFKNTTFWEKIGDHRKSMIDSVEWNKPYEQENKYKPSIIEYYNWDVNRKKDART